MADGYNHFSTVMTVWTIHVHFKTAQAAVLLLTARTSPTTYTTVFYWFGPEQTVQPLSLDIVNLVVVGGVKPTLGGFHLDPCHKLSLRSALIVIDIYRVEEALLNCSPMECCLDGRLSSALSSHAVIPSPSILCHFNREKFTSIVTMTEILKQIVQILN